MSRQPPSSSPELAGKGDQLAAAVGGLQTDVRALSQGLTLMVETQGTHTEMLQKLLEAATQAPSEENSLQDLLARIAAVLEAQTAALRDVNTTLERLPGEMEDAVVRGVTLAAGEGLNVPEQAAC